MSVGSEPQPFRFAPPPAPAPRRSGHSTRFHVLLFVATFLSTFGVQWMLSGRVDAGIAYAVSIMAILTAHEMGHYVMCRRYRVPASLPYFIPMPITMFGTMGAVIRMGGPIRSRQALFDIAVAGPLAGLIVAVPALAWGVAHSTVVEGLAEQPGMITLGEPLLLQWMTDLIVGKLGSGEGLVLHPVAFAGWAGLFVTALNLLPFGQLDGGHIVYAMLGKRSRWVTLLVLVGLVALGIGTGYTGWLIIVGILFFLFYRRGLHHPPILADDRPLDPGRVYLGVAMIGVLIFCFTPVPIVMT